MTTHYRRFKCGTCHRDLHQLFRDGEVFDGHMPLHPRDIAACPSCQAWYAGTPPFRAKREGES